MDEFPVLSCMGFSPYSINLPSVLCLQMLDGQLDPSWMGQTAKVMFARFSERKVFPLCGKIAPYKESSL